MTLFREREEGEREEGERERINISIKLLQEQLNMYCLAKSGWTVTSSLTCTLNMSAHCKFITSLTVILPAVTCYLTYTVHSSKIPIKY